jgi:hypothetical protein
MLSFGAPLKNFRDANDRTKEQQEIVRKFTKLVSEIIGEMGLS